jgi:hypothetical protein
MTGALKHEKRKYKDDFIKYGFTLVVVGGKEMSQCLICCEMLEDESFKQKWI